MTDVVLKRPVPDDLVWRVSAELGKPDGVIAGLRERRAGERLARELRLRVADGVMVTQNGRELFAYAASRETVEAAHRALTDLSEHAGCRATIAVDRWDEPRATWHQVDGPADRPQERAAREKTDERRILPEIGSLRRAILLAGALAGAGAGVSWYALRPTAASYLPSVLLSLPMAMIALVWLHRRLPIWLQWSVAPVIAALGETAYLVEGGSQWWFWGQASVVPLVMLFLHRVFSGDGDPNGTPWYPGGMDGPWGPP